MSDIAGFQCTSCGKCCLEGASTLQAVEADIAMWEAHAPHLLKFGTIHGTAGQRTGDLWPGREAWYSRIYEWRPQVCQRYPTSFEHARFTDCPRVADDMEA